MAVFFYELLRTTRRGRGIWLRVAYGLALLAALAGLFAHWFPGHFGFTPLATPQPARLAKFAEQFAAACLLVQLAAVIVLAPASAAAAIAEERRRGTLDLLRVSGLSAAEVVGGKLAARVLALAAVVLTGVPALALTQLWGGVDPRFLFAGSAVNFLTLFSLSALGLFCSVLTGSTAAAATLAYLVVAGFAALPAGRYANPVHLYGEWLGLLASPGTGKSWAGPVAGYALCHMPLTIVLALAAARCLRPARPRPAAEFARRLALLRMRPGLRRDAAVLAETARRVLETPLARAVPPRAAVRVLPPPRVRGDPLLWKEQYYGGGGTAGEVVRTSSYALCVLQPVMILAPLVPELADPAAAGRIARDVRPLVLTLGLGLLAATALAGTVGAAAGLSGERGRGTLDPLLVLPGGRWAVLRAKWLGSLLRVRGMAAAAAVPWVLGLALGVVQPAAAPLLAVAAAAHLAFLASLGVCVSARAAGPGRAVLTAVAVVLLLSVGPPLLTGLVPFSFPPPTKPWPDVGVVSWLSPPTVWCLLASTRRQWAGLAQQGWTDLALPASLAYALAAAALYALAGWLVRRGDGER
jgi:ABC-type transport system involved in multi-copper enzyme maturation permease subunit